MRTPSPTIAFFGHPVIAAPLMLGGMASLYLFVTQGGGGVLLALPTIIAMGRLAKAIEAVSAHRAWKRAWDSLDAPTPRRAGAWKHGVAVIFIALVVGYGAANPDRADVQTGAIFIALGVLLAMAAFVARRLRALWPKRPRAKPASTIDVVTICARPTLPVPPLRDAYTSLPDYCWQVLGRQ